MAITTIKSTYSLDVETVRTLESLARRWSVSKSEALRRAIRSAAAGEKSQRARDKLAALDKLQASMQGARCRFRGLGARGSGHTRRIRARTNEPLWDDPS